jgi:Kae1-associated kinase Bud32
VGQPPSKQPTSRPSQECSGAARAVGCGDFFDEKANDDIVFIDFGLSFHSDKVEDKAVDIHLFRQALDSKHFKVYDKALEEFMKGYRNAKNHDAIMQRLKAVELRWRYKH